MKLLLLGAHGQVGWELQRALQPLGQVVALGHAEADFEQPQALAALVDAHQPQAIVNAAAYTAVDKAEAEPERARRINAEAPAVLAEAARRHGAWLVHYGTDYVFDGSGSAPRAEDAPTGPLNVYGRTKLEGEQAIAASGCRALVLRTSWVHAARGGNFAKTMLKLAAEREQLKVVNDQVGAPTGADLIADVSAHALRAAMQDPSLAGIYHLVAAGETSWHGYARFVIDWAREHGHPVRVSPEAIEPVPGSAFPTPARRPNNSRLDTTRLRSAFNLHLPPWQQGVARLLKEVLG
jgi:dTDP-4-dehydrorhamnose reductase